MQSSSLSPPSQEEGHAHGTRDIDIDDATCMDGEARGHHHHDCQEPTYTYRAANATHSNVPFSSGAGVGSRSRIGSRSGSRSGSGSSGGGWSSGSGVHLAAATSPAFLQQQVLEEEEHLERIATIAGGGARTCSMPEAKVHYRYHYHRDDSPPLPPLPSSAAHHHHSSDSAGYTYNTASYDEYGFMRARQLQTTGPVSPLLPLAMSDIGESDVASSSASPPQHATMVPYPPAEPPRLTAAALAVTTPTPGRLSSSASSPRRRASPEPSCSPQPTAAPSLPSALRVRGGTPRHHHHHQQQQQQLPYYESQQEAAIGGGDYGSSPRRPFSATTAVTIDNTNNNSQSEKGGGGYEQAAAAAVASARRQLRMTEDDDDDSMVNEGNGRYEKETSTHVNRFNQSSHCPLQQPQQIHTTANANHKDEGALPPAQARVVHGRESVFPHTLAFHQHDRDQQVKQQVKQQHEQPAPSLSLPVPVSGFAATADTGTTTTTTSKRIDMDTPLGGNAASGVGASFSSRAAQLASLEARVLAVLGQSPAYRRIPPSHQPSSFHEKYQKHPYRRSASASADSDISAADCLSSSSVSVSASGRPPPQPTTSNVSRRTEDEANDDARMLVVERMMFREAPTPVSSEEGGEKELNDQRNLFSQQDLSDPHDEEEEDEQQPHHHHHHHQQPPQDRGFNRGGGNVGTALLIDRNDPDVWARAIHMVKHRYQNSQGPPGTAVRSGGYSAPSPLTAPAASAVVAGASSLSSPSPSLSPTAAIRKELEALSQRPRLYDLLTGGNKGAPAAMMTTTLKAESPLRFSHSDSPSAVRAAAAAPAPVQDAYRELVAQRSLKAAMEDLAQTHTHDTSGREEGGEEGGGQDTYPNKSSSSSPSPPSAHYRRFMAAIFGPDGRPPPPPPVPATDLLKPSTTATTTTRSITPPSATTTNVTAAARHSQISVPPSSSRATGAAAGLVATPSTQSLHRPAVASSTRSSGGAAYASSSPSPIPICTASSATSPGRGALSIHSYAPQATAAAARERMVGLVPAFDLTLAAYDTGAGAAGTSTHGETRRAAAIATAMAAYPRSIHRQNVPTDGDGGHMSPGGVTPTTGAHHDDRHRHHREHPPPPFDQPSTLDDEDGLIYDGGHDWELISDHGEDREGLLGPSTGGADRRVPSSRQQHLSLPSPRGGGHDAGHHKGGVHDREVAVAEEDVHCADDEDYVVLPIRPEGRRGHSSDDSEAEGEDITNYRGGHLTGAAAGAGAGAGGRRGDDDSATSANTSNERHFISLKMFELRLSKQSPNRTANPHHNSNNNTPPPSSAMAGGPRSGGLLSSTPPPAVHGSSTPTPTHTTSQSAAFSNGKPADNATTKGEADTALLLDALQLPHASSEDRRLLQLLRSSYGSPGASLSASSSAVKAAAPHSSSSLLWSAQDQRPPAAAAATTGSFATIATMEMKPNRAPSAPVVGSGRDVLRADDMYNAKQGSVKGTGTGIYFGGGGDASTDLEPFDFEL